MPQSSLIFKGSSITRHPGRGFGSGRHLKYTESIMRKLISALTTAALSITSFSLAGTSQAAEEYRLSLNLPIPPIHTRWKEAIKPWCDELTRRSGGRIIIEPYFAEAISKQSESMDSVRDGLADMTESLFTVAVGQFPFFERVWSVPDPSRAIEKPSVILHEMQKSFPQVMDECRGVKLLFTHAQIMGTVIGTKTPVKTLDDLKGKKIASIGGSIAVERLKALGASVVSIPMSDFYMSLQQGIIDGCMVDFNMMVSRRLGDVLKHVTLLSIAGGDFYCCMNQDTYDAMPDDLKKIIDELSGEYADKLFTGYWEGDQYSCLETWKKEMGGTIHMLSDEDYARARERMGASETQWVEELNANGLPGEEMLKRFRELEARYDPAWKDAVVAKYMN